MALVMRGSIGAVIDVSRTWLFPSRTLPRRIWPPAIGLAYIALVAELGGLHGGNVLLGMLGCLDAYNAKTRVFLRTFAPCIVTGALYDGLRFVLHPAIDGRIHVVGPYLIDRTYFAIGGQTMNEIFAAHHWVVADLVTGCAYLFYVAEYLVLAMIVFGRGDARSALTFARGFLVVNAMGFVTWLAYPAAPPWYVTAHGFASPASAVLPSAGGALRFDAALGTHVFANIYGHSINAFGAIPSLHAAYPALGAVLAWRTPLMRWARWPAIAFALLICFSAVYLQHHYVIDVVLGLVYAAITAAIVIVWERRSKPA